MTLIKNIDTNKHEHKYCEQHIPITKKKTIFTLQAVSNRGLNDKWIIVKLKSIDMQSHQSNFDDMEKNAKIVLKESGRFHAVVWSVQFIFCLHNFSLQTAISYTLAHFAIDFATV